MPPIREHRILYKFLADEEDEDAPRDEEDDDDEEDTGMPPLVDNPFAFLPTPDEDAPNAPPHPHPTQESMMSSLDFTGVSFPASSAFTFSVTAGDADNNEITPSASTGGRGSRRAAARAPSYIPRPPNAFILFRSSFIRSQNVPGRVEGNHSTLSKIIGKYWHALPPAERARWEDKARLAQAEHRRRYPDWRFRPGNGKNAFISGASGPVASGSGSGSSAKPRGRRKGRIKDGGGDDPDPPPPSTPPPPDDDEERGRSAKGKERAGVGVSAVGKGKGKAKAKAVSVDARGKGKGRARGDGDADGDEGGDADYAPAVDRKGKGRARPRANTHSIASSTNPFAVATTSSEGTSTAAAALHAGAIDADADAEMDEEERTRKREHQAKVLAMERARAEEKERERIAADARCEKITDLLVEGKTGSELEKAVEEWERAGGAAGAGSGGAEEGRGVVAAHTLEREASSGRVRAPAGTRGRGREREREREKRERRGVDVSSDAEREREKERQPFPQSQRPPLSSPFASPTRAPFALQQPPPVSPFASGSPAHSPFAQSSPFAHQQQQHSPFASPMDSPYGQPPPGSPFVPGSPFAHQQQQHTASPFASVSASPVPAHAHAVPIHPPYTSESGTSTEGNNIQTRRTAAASSLMLPPLTHMYKRSLSAPVGVRRLAPPLLSPPILRMGMPQSQSPVMSISRMDDADAAMVMSPVMSAMGTNAGGGMGMGMERVQEDVGVGPAYPSVSGYFVPAPAPVQQRHQYGQQQQGYTHGHVRRDTISLPVFGGAGRRVGEHHPRPAESPPTPHKRARGGAYTYPPPYAHTPLPMPAGGGSIDAGPGPAPSYGGSAQAGWWWDRTRGREGTDLYAESRGQERVGAGEDDGWADGGVSFGEYVPGPPSPSPPASLASPSASASPYAAHATAVPVPIPIRLAGAHALGTSPPGPAGPETPFRQRADPYAQPLPLSPLSDAESATGGRGARFRFPPRIDAADLEGVSGRGGFQFPPPQALGQGAPISSFSTLSGWAGDFAVSPTSMTSFAQGSSGNGTAQGNVIAGGSGAGTPPPQTSGWYQPPGWENSVQGSFSAAPPLSTGMAAAQDDDAWADAGPGYASLKASAAAWPPMTPEWSTARGDVEMYDWGARR